jgi:hypothetical protein
MCRLCFRELALKGEVPGVVKGELVVRSDPIADLLTRIRNASNAEHEKVDIPVLRLRCASPSC